MSTPNALTYNGFVTQLGVLAVLQTATTGGVTYGTDSYFTSLIPQALNYAELRIQRDLDFLQSRTSAQFTLANGKNIFRIPLSTFVTVLSILGPGGIPLLPVTQEWLQNTFNTSASNAAPAYFAPVGQDVSGELTYMNIMVGPGADRAYSLTVWGTTRLISLATYATNGPAASSTTFISTWLPDMLLQAAMIYVSQFQRQFSAAANDPQMPGAYETQYQTLLKGALVEELRKKFQSSAWSSQSPAPVATAGR